MSVHSFHPHLQVNRPLTMKKDGIQTRNRKMSAKGKKKKGLHGHMMDMSQSAIDFIKQGAYDHKPFSSFAHGQPFNPATAMHPNPMHSYMSAGNGANVNGLAGNGFASHHNSAGFGSGLGHVAGGFNPLVSMASSSLNSQAIGGSPLSAASFNGIQGGASGLALASNSGIIGAIA